MNELLSVAIAVIAGLVMTRLIKPLHLPDVTAYLLTGVVLGPYLIGSLGIGGIGFCSAESISALRSVSETALGFIAFAIGNEFRLNELKKIGKSAAIIAVLQALSAAVVTDLALILVHLAIPEKFSFSAAITLGFMICLSIALKIFPMIFSNKKRTQNNGFHKILISLIFICKYAWYTHKNYTFVSKTLNDFIYFGYGARASVKDYLGVSKILNL